MEPNPHWYDDSETIDSRPQHPRYQGHVQWRDPWVVRLRVHLLPFPVLIPLASLPFPEAALLPPPPNLALSNAASLSFPAHFPPSSSLESLSATAALPPPPSSSPSQSPPFPGIDAALAIHPCQVGPVKGTFYMFITAACAELSSPWRGCIGLATAPNPLGPWEVQEPALIALIPEGLPNPSVPVPWAR